MVSQRQSYLRLLTAKNRCCVFFIRITFNTSSIATAQTKHEEFSEVWLGRLGGPRSSQRPFFEVFCITLGDQIARLHTGDGGWHPNRVNLSTIDSCRQGTYGRASERAGIRRARARVSMACSEGTWNSSHSTMRMWNDCGPGIPRLSAILSPILNNLCE